MQVEAALRRPNRRKKLSKVRESFNSAHSHYACWIFKVARKGDCPKYLIVISFYSAERNEIHHRYTIQRKDERANRSYKGPSTRGAVLPRSPHGIWRWRKSVCAVQPWFQSKDPKSFPYHPFKRASVPFWEYLQHMTTARTCRLAGLVQKKF